MTPNEATNLAETITKAFPGRGVDHQVWTVVLEPLDYQQALTAVVALVETLERPPAVAAFKAAYHAQRPTRGHYQSDCELCFGSGWEQIETQRAGHLVASGVVPCKCSAGHANQDAWSRALDHNDETCNRSRRTRTAA